MTMELVEKLKGSNHVVIYLNSYPYRKDICKGNDGLWKRETFMGKGTLDDETLASHLEDFPEVTSYSIK